MRFREGAAYPFLFAEDDPNEEKTKARIDLPRVSSDADLALKNSRRASAPAPTPSPSSSRAGAGGLPRRSLVMNERDGSSASRTPTVRVGATRTASRRWPGSAS